LTGLPQIPSTADWTSLSVESTLAATLIALLLLPFFVRSKRALGATALIGLVTAIGTTFLPHGISPTFGGMVIADPAATLWRQVLLAFTSGIVLMWLNATDTSNSRVHATEFLTLLISATLGLSLMGATTNLLLIVLGTELASMPSYILAGFRKNRRYSAEAALKYVLFGGVCTATMIYGLSLLYGAAGTLDAGTWLMASHGAFSPVAVLGSLFLLVGLLFKISAVPAHFWCPDVFEGAPVDVSAFLSVASKGAGIVVLARLWEVAAQHQTPSLGGMAAVLGVVAVLTTTAGNFGALRQNSV
jgi:NADH-quinone oxidoreductase subunit N